MKQIYILINSGVHLIFMKIDKLLIQSGAELCQAQQSLSYLLTGSQSTTSRELATFQLKASYPPAGSQPLSIWNQLVANYSLKQLPASQATVHHGPSFEIILFWMAGWLDGRTTVIIMLLSPAGAWALAQLGNKFDFFQLKIWMPDKKMSFFNSAIKC